MSSPSSSAGGHREEPVDLPVDDDGVQPFLAAEVLVDDWLGNAGLGGDLLNGGAVQAAFGEQPPPDVEELLASFLTCHALAAVADRTELSPVHHGRSGTARRTGSAAARRVMEPSCLVAVFLPFSLVSSGHRTSYAQPSFSQTQMSRARDVDLAAQRAVPRAGRVGVVQVVPRLAEGQDGQPVHVPRLVPDLELLLAEGVADRVDRPGHVMQEGDPDQAGPEERDDGALP